nr:hypothetical protein [Tanacetum cinerariifolium]
ELSERSLGEDIKITDKLESLEKDNNGIKNLDNKNMDVVIVFQEVGKHDSETNKGEVLNLQPPYEESKPESPNTKPNSSVIGSKVVEVTIDGGNTESVVANVPLKDKGSPEKFNLDPSSGDDSMKEDVLETKKIDSKFNSQHIGYVNDKTQVSPFKEGEPLDVMANNTHAAKNDESAKNTSDYATMSTKRKLNDLAPIRSAVLTDQHICMIHLEIMKSNITCQCYSHSGEGNCRRA